MEDSINFYNDLQLFPSLANIRQTNLFRQVPEDWFVIITDIKGSTKAIESGKYKDVNFIAASSIICVLNEVKEIEIPFIFGGDGGTMLLPGSMLERVKTPLLETARRSKVDFGLELRVGMVHVKEIYDKGSSIRVAKLKVSENYHQAIVTGKGLSLAEKLIKDPQYSDKYLLKYVSDKMPADFTGLECRWKDIRTRHDEVISLVVSAKLEEVGKTLELYSKILEKVTELFGGIENRHPIISQNLKLSFKPSNLSKEVKIKNANLVFGVIRSQLENVLGNSLIKLRMKTSNLDWGKYKKIISISSDTEKFDDTLRMVFSGSTKSREDLEVFLNELEDAGKIVYGINIAKYAQMTCYVLDRGGKQVHFVDGGNGGLTFAAKKIKNKLNATG